MLGALPPSSQLNVPKRGIADGYCGESQAWWDATPLSFWINCCRGQCNSSGIETVNKSERQRYLENAYRVLLTRARQGMVLVVPHGDDDDPTRAREFYDPTYDYLKSLGLPEI